ncbi:MAG TPA: ABC transporter ATP-binding protein [bacterium]|jgi:putative ABC transport system ATP-binding protein
MSEKSLIKVENVKKIYRMGGTSVHALDGVNLTIENGEFVAIMGVSGSGKSTLMNILGCLDRPTSGHYRLSGDDVSTMTDNELAHVRNERIGFVFQSFNLLPRTSAIENVELPLVYANASHRREKSIVALTKVGLGERVHHRPNELSGGEQQRVAVARAIINNPDILLADEPTGNLDSRVSAEIMELFWELNVTGKTILIVTHEEEIAEYAGRVVRMLDGKKISDTTHPPKLSGSRVTA